MGIFYASAYVYRMPGGEFPGDMPRQLLIFFKSLQRMERLIGEFKPLTLNVTMVSAICAKENCELQRNNNFKIHFNLKSEYTVNKSSR